MESGIYVLIGIATMRRRRFDIHDVANGGDLSRKLMIRSPRSKINSIIRNLNKTVQLNKNSSCIIINNNL